MTSPRRSHVLELRHIVFAGRMRIQNTKGRIEYTFYWPTLQTYCHDNVILWLGHLGDDWCSEIWRMEVEVSSQAGKVQRSGSSVSILSTYCLCANFCWIWCNSK